MGQIENERKKNADLQNEIKLMSQSKQDYEHEIKRVNNKFKIIF